MQSVSWRGTIADMLWWEFAEATKAFRQTILSPGYAALADLETVSAPKNTKELVENYRRQVAAQSSRKALALGLAGLWESQFREHLGKSANIIKIDDLNSEKIEAASSFAKLEEYFKNIRGFPLSTFPQYEIIKCLIVVGNAARHGNGYSSKAVHRKFPQYFTSTRPHAGWYSFYLHGATQPQDVRYLHVTTAHLEEFADAMISFWEEIKALAQFAKNGRG